MAYLDCRFSSLVNTNQVRHGEGEEEEKEEEEEAQLGGRRKKEKGGGGAKLYTPLPLPFAVKMELVSEVQFSSTLKKSSEKEKEVKGHLQHRLSSSHFAK